MRDLLCPECGTPLSIEVKEDNATGFILISLFCEGPGDDEYRLEINTCMWNEEFSEWEEIGSTQNMSMKLVERKPDQDYTLNWDTMELLERDH
jgi:hypothetical protein